MQPPERSPRKGTSDAELVCVSIALLVKATDVRLASTVDGMADPVISGVYRSMLVLQGSSGLPEDRFITTWCFRTDGAADHDLVAAKCGVLLADFMNEPVGVASHVGAYIGPQASRAAAASKVVTYHLGETPPRIPREYTFQLAGQMAGTGGLGMPAEVACCLSLKTIHAGPSGLGRVYIGPMVMGASVAGTWSESRPTTGLTDALCLSAGRLLEDAAAGAIPLVWCVLSQKNAAAYDIEGGWVDDAWDTQRRRGLDATGRVLWPVP